MDEAPPRGRGGTNTAEGVQSCAQTVLLVANSTVTSQHRTNKGGPLPEGQPAVCDRDAADAALDNLVVRENYTYNTSPPTVCSLASSPGQQQVVGGEIHLGSCPQFELGVSSERVEDELPGGHSEVASQRLLAAADHGDLMEFSAGATNITCASTYRYLKLLCPGEAADLEGTVGELYECRWLECPETFDQLEQLVNHVNDQHVKVERDVEYKCRWASCPRKGKGFNARYKMLIHVRTHTNEKPHECGLCGKSFSRLENLKIHNRSHTGEKPYICPFEGCNKAYSNSSDRFKHVRTHQTDKPYRCKTPGCHKRYTDPSSLRKHIKTHGHFFRSRERDLQPQNDHLAQASPVTLMTKDLTKPITGNALLTLTQSGILNHSLPTQVISIQGNMLHISTLASNPLLSSTVTSVVNSHRHSTSTQTDVASDVTLTAVDSPVKELQEAGILDEGGKEQETPLDLSTSPILAGHQDDSSDTNGTHYTTMWKFVSAD